MILEEIEIPNPGKNAFSHSAAFGFHRSMSKTTGYLAPVSTSAVAGKNPIQASGAIRKWMYMILKEITIPNPGKNVFSHGAPRSPSSGVIRG
jgi:hypothetical protein